MNEPTPSRRASHVNSGTSVPASERAWPDRRGPVLSGPRLKVREGRRADVTAVGGLILPVELARHFGLAEEIDARVEVLKRHKPYHESDHVLAMALMLYAGGTCLEDMSMIQQDEVLLKMFEACRLPDPTTAGDFLRRFADVEALEGLRESIDVLTDRALEKLARRRRFDNLLRPGRASSKRMIVLDIDGHNEETTSKSKEGADFSYKGEYSHGMLVATLDNRLCVGVRLRSGNIRSSTGAAALLDEVLPRLKKHVDKILVRADSDYDRKDIRDACTRHGAYYAFVGRSSANRHETAKQQYEWFEFEPRARREHERRRRRPGHKTRRRRQNLRRGRARARGYKHQSLFAQDIAETKNDDGTRLVMRRQQIEVIEGKARQCELFFVVRYRYVVTNLPSTWTTEQVIDETYKRCDQENIIEQLGSGVSMWRLPVGDFDGNKAWVEIARLAWNLRILVSLLALPDETVRWEWKRFRRAFLHVVAQVVHHARQLHVRILGKNGFTGVLVRAHAALQA